MAWQSLTPSGGAAFASRAPQPPARPEPLPLPLPPRPPTAPLAAAPHLGPLAHHRISLALHLVGAGVQQDGVAPDQLRAALGLQRQAGKRACVGEGQAGGAVQ